MLILTRRPGEIIDITLEDGRRIEIGFLRVIGNQTRVSVECDRSIVVDRREITKRKRREEMGGEVNGNVAEPTAGTEPEAGAPDEPLPDRVPRLPVIRLKPRKLKNPDAPDARRRLEGLR